MPEDQCFASGGQPVPDDYCDASMVCCETPWGMVLMLESECMAEGGYAMPPDMRSGLKNISK